MKKYDLVIIGGGPAGSSAALYASLHGIKALVVERKKIPGTPVLCAEGASVKGIELVIKKIKNCWIANKTNKVFFKGPNHKSFTVRFSSPGYILERRVFDRDLLAIASDKTDVMIETEATQVLENTVYVEHRKKREKIHFDFLIIAEGIESKIARSLNLTTPLKLSQIHSCAQYLIAGINIDASGITLILDREKCPGGYIWIFPKDENLANIGLGIAPFLTDKPAHYFLNSFIRENFPNAKIIEKSGGFVSAVVMKGFGKKNILIAGDAGRLIDPMSGAGIVNAMLSGKLAVESIVDSKTTEIHKIYNKKLEKAFVKNLRFNEKMRRIFLKLKNDDFLTIFEFGEEYLEKEKIEKFDLKRIWRMIVKYSPKFLKMAGKIVW